MAQDIVDSHPEALVTDSKGYYPVRYDLLGLKMAKYEDWVKNGVESVQLAH